MPLCSGRVSPPGTQSAPWALLSRGIAIVAACIDREKPIMIGKFFAAFSNFVADCMGNPVAFVLALLAIVVWGISGPIFGYSETWQLVVNTGTTIVTFLMMFVLQNSQNRDGKALQAKLDELIRTSKAANEFIGVEKLDDKELARMRQVQQESCAEAVHSA